MVSPHSLIFYSFTVPSKKNGSDLANASAAVRLRKGAIFPPSGRVEGTNSYDLTARKELNEKCLMPRIDAMISSRGFPALLPITAYNVSFLPFSKSRYSIASPRSPVPRHRGTLIRGGKHCKRDARRQAPANKAAHRPPSSTPLW